jgi:mannose-6-phosphate isomerase
VPTLRDPLSFERHFVPKPAWGGRALESALGLALPPGMAVGETWEVVDRAQENSVVSAGPLAGCTLGALMQEYREELLGTASATPTGRFPLLVKFLDATGPLSVQVHPDEAGACAQGRGSEPKTEAWYYLRAEEGGGVWSGLRPGTDAATLVPNFGARAVVDHLSWWPVRAGQVQLVRGGTVHAIGAGVVLLEVQQNSDTTWRIYDWDRPGSEPGGPRPLHLAQAAAVTRYDLAPSPPQDPDFGPLVAGARVAPLVRCESFDLDRIDVNAPVQLGTGQQFQILVAVGGAGLLVAGRGGHETVSELRPGRSLLLPAALDRFRLEPDAGEGLALVRVRPGRAAR